MPRRAAKAPPRSMSATRIALASAALATRRLVTSKGRRLGSAGLPAPSIKTRSYSERSALRLSSIGGQRWGARSFQGTRESSGRTLPRTTTWLLVSASGFKSTGFIRTSGGTPAARAW